MATSNFIDTATIWLHAGKGGDGAVTFHREKFVAAGGPDGGDGGRGGDIIFVADDNLSTLMDFRYKRKYTAPDGENGRAKRMSGADGDDLVIRVPRGTVLKEAETDLVVADLTGSEPVVVAKGGRGGWGNSHFATPTRQIPKFAKPGLPGEDMHLKLELKVIADVGLIGFPNVGKSTLISIISAARPKIANYHFTTLTPVLGVVRVGPEQSFVCADIPGLIEGAAEGVGLGHDFLRHVERCRLLLHVVDVSGCEGRDPKADFEQINHELAGFSAELAERPQIVLGNKCDIATPEQVEEFKQLYRGAGPDLPADLRRDPSGRGRPARAGLQPPEGSASGQDLRGRVQAPRQERPAYPPLHGGAHRRPRVHRRCPLAGAYPCRHECRGLREPAVFPDAAG